MIAIELTVNEILQFQYILPVQGSLQTLELVEKILDKTKIEGKEDLNVIKFDKSEIQFIKNMIDHLDSQSQLNFQSLSLIKKFLKIKGE